MKPWKSLQEQVDLLKSRGMVISDDELAKQCLSKIGYYRLSGYWYPFRQHNTQYNKTDLTSNQRLDCFVDGTSFGDIVSLYVFDKKLRLLAMDVLERIEIAIRFEVAYCLGFKDPCAYDKERWFNTRFIQSGGHKKFKESHEKCVSRSREEFIKHHKRKNLILPIWVACEVWDFGMLSHLLEGMKKTDQTKIAQKFGLTQGNELVSWLKSLSILRNLCAHHSRVWNKGLAIVPRFPQTHSMPWINSIQANNMQTGRVFVLLCICAQILRTIQPRSGWTSRVIEHLKTFPNINHQEINLCAMGCCGDWEEVLTRIYK